MTLREAIDGYVAWRRALGAHFQFQACALRRYSRQVGKTVDCDAARSDQVNAFLGSRPPASSNRLFLYRTLAGSYRYAITRSLATHSPLPGRGSQGTASRSVTPNRRPPPAAAARRRPSSAGSQQPSSRPRRSNPAAAAYTPVAWGGSVVFGKALLPHPVPRVLPPVHSHWCKMQAASLLFASLLVPLPHPKREWRDTPREAGIWLRSATKCGQV